MKQGKRILSQGAINEEERSDSLSPYLSSPHGENKLKTKKKQLPNVTLPKT